MMMLIDKGFYDYDFSRQAIDDGRRRRRIRSKQAQEIWSDDRVSELLNTAINPLTGRRVFEQPMTAEQMQQLAIKEMGIEQNEE